MSEAKKRDTSEATYVLALELAVDAAAMLLETCPVDCDATEEFGIAVSAFDDAMAPVVRMQADRDTTQSAPELRTTATTARTCAAPGCFHDALPERGHCSDACFKASLCASDAQAGPDGHVRCTLCGATRFLENGRPGVCSFTECKDPAHDLDRENGLYQKGWNAAREAYQGAYGDAVRAEARTDYPIPEHVQTYVNAVGYYLTEWKDGDDPIHVLGHLAQLHAEFQAAQKRGDGT